MVTTLKNSELNEALNDSVEEICEFIIKKEEILTDENRQVLFDFLSSIDFSKKYELLTAPKNLQVKGLLVGLLYGQIDPHVAQVPEIMDGYLNKFNAVCMTLGLSETFISPICGYETTICELF